MKNYTRYLQNRFDRAFTIIIGIASVIAFIAAILLFFADIPKGYSVLNLSAGIILSTVFILQKHVRSFYKIFTIIVITIIVAIASFIGGSVTSAFLSIFIISNIIAAFFLQPRFGVAVSIVTLIIVICLIYFFPEIDANKLTNTFTTWFLQIMGLALLLAVLNISAYYIKKQLVKNIRDLEESIEYSNKLAYFDQLTKLPNMHKFLVDVEAMIQQDPVDGFIVFIYIENISLINASLGHKFGDQLLIEVAEILKPESVNDTYIARTDGNQFAIWFQNIEEDRLINKLQQISLELKQGTHLNKKLRINIAYSVFKHGIDSIDSCYQKATFALAYAKKNKIHEFTPYNDMIEKELRRKEIIKESIAEAIRNKNFELYYQPKYNARNMQIIGVEGLARWKTDELGIVSPSEFLPIIESLNLSAQFGTYVIEQACRDFALLQHKFNKGIHISINISPSQIINPDIVNTIKNALRKHSMPHNAIYIEITEEIFINNIEIVKPIIKELRASGIKVSLDDFGSGFSSLFYLTQLELDEIKVDKSIIDEVGKNDKVILLLENIMHLANQFGYEIIVEGVETKLQNDALTNLGYYFFQGFYYARPEPLERPNGETPPDPNE